MAKTTVAKSLRISVEAEEALRYSSQITGISQAQVVCQMVVAKAAKLRETEKQGHED